ncbi:hypothetical protein ACOMHN_007943 [Nucella lapillus]
MESTVPQQSSSDYTYEDDFEELDSFIKEKENDSSESNAKISPRSKSSTNKGDGPRADSRTLDSDVHEEKGQRESSGQVPMEKDKPRWCHMQKVKGAPTFDDLQSDDSEPEPEGDVMFTQDQHRAMMELMAQKHDSGDYAGTPQEYTVKGRLKELNAELAKEPEPDDRRHRVGFKKELVDLVAPAPEVSDDDDDDDDSPRKALPDGADRDNKKQFVVERDGKFDILAHHELSASERAMFNIAGQGGGDTGPDLSEKTAGGGTAWQEKTGGPSRRTLGSEDNWQPQPPSKPRPNTANDGCRRSVHVSPRPRTAASPGRSTNANHGPALQDFNYSSPYAMSSTEKERAQERARLRDQQRMEEERRRQEEEEYRRQESEDAFRAWLQHKSDDGRRKRHDDDDRKRRDSKDDKPAEPVWKDTEPVWKDTEPVWKDTEPVWKDTEPVWKDTEPVEGH